MNSMFKGILIGLFTSVLLLLFVKIFFYSEIYPNPTNTINQNNEISVKPSIQNGKPIEKQPNTQIKQSNNFCELPTKSDESIKQQAESD